MVVRKRQGGRWQWDVCVKKGKTKIRRRGAAPSRRVALEMEATERRKLMAGAFVQGRSPFFVDFADEFRKVYAAANNKPSERAAKEMILRKHLTPAFGVMRLDAIGVQHVEHYKAEKLAAGLKPKTVNNHLIVLAKLFAVAKDWGRLSEPPKCRRMKAELPGVDFLSADEVLRLMTVTDPPWSNMVKLALCTGLRVSELVALRWADVAAGESRKLVVRYSAWGGKVGTPKGGKAKEVPLSTPAVAALAGQHDLSAGGALVFPGHDGAMLTREACRKPLRRLLARAGVRQVSWHVFRHTFGSHLAMGGTPLRAIQELLRHESIAMTLRYSHLSPGVTADAVGRLYQEPKT